MSSDSFWEFGLGYLEQCTHDGKSGRPCLIIRINSNPIDIFLGIDAIEILLPKVIIRNEKQALKVANIAQNIGLFDIGRLVYKLIA